MRLSVAVLPSVLTVVAALPAAARLSARRGDILETVLTRHLETAKRCPQAAQGYWRNVSDTVRVSPSETATVVA